MIILEFLIKIALLRVFWGGVSMLCNIKEWDRLSKQDIAKQKSKLETLNFIGYP